VAHDWGRFFKWVEPGEFQRMGIPKDLQEFLEENGIYCIMSKRLQ